MLRERHKLSKYDIKILETTQQGIMNFPRVTHLVLLCSALFSADAFSTRHPSSPKHDTTSLMSTTGVDSQPSSRREWMGTVGGMAAFATTIATTTASVTGFPQGALAASVTEEYLAELQTSLTKLQPIPKLLEEQKWDEARTILKSPPVNKLWNLGDGQNTVLKLVKETGNVDLFEVKDDLAYNLQMCDQLTYDNNFIYYQPGNGKLKLKEPIEAINKSLQLLETIIKDSS